MNRILFLLPTLRSGGAERQAVTIASLLKGKGYDVDFLVYFEGDFYESKLKDAGIKVHRKVCNYLRRVVYVTFFIHKRKYDVVISFMPTPNFLNCFAAVMGKRWRVIISERSSKEQDIVSLHGKIKSFFYRKADVIVCNSYNSKMMWMKFHSNYNNKLTTIYNTVILGDVSTEYKPKRDGKVHVIIAATISKIKNPMGLLKALLMLNSDERNLIRIDWYGKSEAAIGDNGEYKKVVTFTKENDLYDLITIHDATQDIANRMYEADCVALFSRLEGLPNAICEGMMLGKPIIMSQCSDYSTLVEEGNNGFLCEWDKPETIKDALLNLAKLNVEELVNMGMASKKKAEQLFAKESVLNQWESVLNNG